MTTLSKTSEAAVNFDASTRVYKQVRAAITDQILVILACLSIPALCVDLASIPYVGFKKVMVMHIVLTILVIATAVFRQWASLWVRVAAVIAPLFLVGLGDVTIYRFSTGAPAYLVSVCIIATMFFGVRGGVGAIAAVVVTVEALFAAQTHGFVQLIDFALLRHSSLYYLDPVMAIIVGGVGPVAGIRYLVQELVRDTREIADLAARSQALNQMYEEAERIGGVGSWQYDISGGSLPEWSAGAYSLHDIDPFDHEQQRNYLAARWSGIPGEWAAGTGVSFERPFDLVFLSTTATGRAMWLHLRSEPVFKDGKVVGVRGYMQDVTSRKQVEDTNAQLLSRLERVERTAGVGGWEYDVETGGLHWTSGASLIHDLDPADMAGFERYLPTVWSSTDPMAASSRVVADPSTPVDVTLERITAKGRKIWLHIRAEPIFRGGKLAAVVGHYQDITERKANEDRLVELARNLKAEHDRAEIANAAKSQFLAMMSHELRTPLTGVIGLAELLQASGLSEPQQLLTRRLVRSASILLDLLNDILDFSAIEAGRLRVENTLFSVRELISDITELFQATAVEKGISLEAVLAADLEDAVVGDSKRLRQVFSNLVSNALKFTEQGAITITVRQDRRADRKLLLQAAVADTGIGIAPEDIGRLFAPFVRAEWPAAHKHGGTGLGLAISRRLVEAMAGQIAVSSTPGRGSTFTFGVMLQGDRRVPGPRDGAHPAAPPRRRATDRLKESATLHAPVEARPLLLAEDNETNRVLIAAMLNRFGYTVDAVEDGHKAVMAVQARRYGLILMDIQMPVMDGDAAMRVIRAAEADARLRTPIIALTADALVEHADVYRAAGADSVVTKPIDWNFLAAEIRRLLSAVPVTDVPAVSRLTLK